MEKPDQRPHIFWPDLQHLSTDLTNQMIERDDPSQNPKRSLVEVAHPGLMSCEWQSGPLVWWIRIGRFIPIHQETLLKVHFPVESNCLGDGGDHPKSVVGRRGLGKSPIDFQVRRSRFPKLPDRIVSLQACMVPIYLMRISKYVVGAILKISQDALLFLST